MTGKELAYEVGRLLDFCELTRKEVLVDFDDTEKAVQWERRTAEERREIERLTGGLEAPVPTAAGCAAAAWACCVVDDLLFRGNHHRRDPGLELNRRDAWNLCGRLLLRLKEVDELT